MQKSNAHYCQSLGSHSEVWLVAIVIIVLVLLLKEQLSQLQERTKEQRAELETELEAKIASMREENRRIAASTQ